MGYRLGDFLNKHFVTIFSLLLVICVLPFSINAAEVEVVNCISPTDGSYGNLKCGDGALLSAGQWCTYTIDPEASGTGRVVIEVISGGRYDSDRDQYYNIGNKQDISVWVNRESAPVYILCHETEAVNAQDGSVGWAKSVFLQSAITGISDSAYYDITPEDTIAAGIKSMSGSIASFPEDINSVIVGKTIDTSYITYTSDDKIFLGFGGLLFILGLFGIITMIAKSFRSKNNDSR